MEEQEPTNQVSRVVISRTEFCEALLRLENAAPIATFKIMARLYCADGLFVLETPWTKNRFSVHGYWPQVHIVNLRELLDKIGCFSEREETEIQIIARGDQISFDTLPSQYVLRSDESAHVKDSKDLVSDGSEGRE